MSEAPRLTCRELTEFIAAYLDDELPREERERFAEHLATCRACVDYVVSYRETLRATQRARADEDLESVPEDLVLAVLASRRRR